MTEQEVQALVSQMTDFFTFSFNVNPELNGGFAEVFKQGDEPWWWYVNADDGPAAGPTPNFTGATFKSLHQWNKQLLP